MISIIIPVLNEERALPGLLANLRSLAAPEHGSIEVLVVDGGSEDRTRQIVRGDGARLVEADRGRGVQIQTGAEEAAGQLLLVVHADARLPHGAMRQVERAVAEGSRWGWFDIRYDAPGAWLRFVARYLNVHASLLGSPTGENAMWATREAWEAVGGCPRIPLMEDAVLARRLKRLSGGRRLPGPVVCSARRFHAWTPLGMSARCTMLRLLFHLGASPHWLQRFYPEVR